MLFISSTVVYNNLITHRLIDSFCNLCISRKMTEVSKLSFPVDDDRPRSPTVQIRNPSLDLIFYFFS
jgi:hypothetical protein